MTNAQRQATRAPRSRILGSIFARTPRDTVIPSDQRHDPRGDASTAPASSIAPAKPNGWRDVTTRHARETIAERICSRFFGRGAHEGPAHAGTQTEAGFTTAGQRLEALSGEAGAVGADHPNLAAVLGGSALREALAAAQRDEAGEASLDASLTAKAA